MSLCSSPDNLCLLNRIYDFSDPPKKAQIALAENQLAKNRIYTDKVYGLNCKSGPLRAAICENSSSPIKLPTFWNKVYICSWPADSLVSLDNC
jgi:hypothetical protein